MRHQKALVAAFLLACVALFVAIGEPLYLAGDCGEVPVVNLPQGLRQRNWLKNGSGSCVHASFIMLMRWQGHDQFADWWRANHGGGEWPETFAKKLDNAGIYYGETREGDVAFLDWACKTRRGALVVTGVYTPGDHAVCLVHFDAKWAGILDNNDVGTITWVPRADFILWWKTCGGWALSPCYSPMPPLPK